MIALFGHFGLRQIENQCAPRGSKCKDPLGKIGCKPQCSNGGVPEAIIGEGLP